jgi:Uma2 family endonuclease
MERFKPPPPGCSAWRLEIYVLPESTDHHEDVVEKVELYLESGVVVWVIDPYFRTVSVHRPGHPVATYNDDQELTGEPELPGFRVAVARIFGR